MLTHLNVLESCTGHKSDLAAYSTHLRDWPLHFLEHGVCTSCDASCFMWLIRRSHVRVALALLISIKAVAPPEEEEVDAKEFVEHVDRVVFIRRIPAWISTDVLGRQVGAIRIL